MNNYQKKQEYDFIVVGSGASGSIVSRELARNGKKVLLLERGDDILPKESLLNLARVSDEVKLGKKLVATRGMGIGGSTSIYFGVVGQPHSDAFKRLGIDLSEDIEAIRRELPIGVLPDRLISAKAVRVQESATELGHVWQKHEMFIEPEKCPKHYNFDAIWRARNFVDEAVGLGVELVSHALVSKVLLDGSRAIGVAYTRRKGLIRLERRQAFATKIIVCAGELETPNLLRRSGLAEVGSRGFYCNPGYVLYGLVPGLSGENSFVGSMGTGSVEGIELGDANICRFFHNMLMTGSMKLRHLLAYPETIGIGVKVRDELGGSLSDRGKLFKDFTPQERAALSKGEQAARAVLARAGAKHVANFGLVCAGRVGGMVDIQEHVDARLETRFRNLHVCDGSILPSETRCPPTATLLCLGRYLARVLLADGWQGVQQMQTMQAMQGNDS